MQRIVIPPRLDWQAKVEALGLVWHTAADVPYWNEAAYYAFTAEEIDRIEAATRTLYGLFLEAGDYIVERRLFDRFAIPEWCWPLIEQAWRAEPPALNYGRFDLGFDGYGAPKLFEFNCDTPTSLVEAAVIQWAWKEEVFPAQDQFNSLHDRLVAKWRDIGPYLAPGAPIHFTHAIDSVGEDSVTTAYLMDTARAAGLAAERIVIGDIGWDGRRFLDLDEREIRTLYHLYPWEWLVKESFGRHLLETQDRTLWIEPIWKMIWSNKAILPILWDLHPRHENLLWATRDKPASDSYAQKPILAREGANVRLVRDGYELAASDGSYGGSPVVYQGLYELPNFDGARPVIGSWVVDGEPAGLGIREDGPITGNLSRFVPHIIHG
jgi:glutathionylspermidine synthase